MKKIILAVMVISLAALFVTCDEPITDDDAIVEYSDVVYSPDGSEVTVYLDGKTVPVTKAQRAMHRDLAMMSYDFLEVIFVGETDVARSNWELGMPAGLYGVNRDSTDYTSIENACLFAGKKSDKTLFGIGKIGDTGVAAGVINADVDSVTFKIAAILTGLPHKGDSTVPTGNGTPSQHGVYYASLPVSDDVVDFAGVQYPVYDLGIALTKTYSYKFGMVQSATYLSAAKLYGTTDAPPVAQRRTPRFLDGGAYREPKNLVNTKTTVAITGTFTSVQTFTEAFPSDTVTLTFTSITGAAGYLSVYLEIPVFNTDNTGADWVAGTNDTELKYWTKPVKWFIRTGYGSELYSIDDGASPGGCVLFSRGTTGGGSGWLDIEWGWIPYTGTPVP